MYIVFMCFIALIVVAMYIFHFYISFSISGYRFYRTWVGFSWL